MKSTLIILIALFMAGCSTVQYQVIPVGNKGAGFAVSMGRKTAEFAANNYGKILTTLTVAATIYKVGDNSGWWSSQDSGQGPVVEPSTSSGGPSFWVGYNSAPVTIIYYGGNYTEESK